MALALASFRNDYCINNDYCYFVQRNCIEVSIEKLLNFTVKIYMLNIGVQYRCSALWVGVNFSECYLWCMQNQRDGGVPLIQWFQFCHVYWILCGRLANMSCIPLLPWYHEGPLLSLRSLSKDSFLNRKDKQAPRAQATRQKFLYFLWPFYLASTPGGAGIPSRRAVDMTRLIVWEL